VRFAFDLRLSDPAPQGRLGEVQLPRHRAHGLPTVPDDPDGLCLTQAAGHRVR